MVTTTEFKNHLKCVTKIAVMELRSVKPRFNRKARKLKAGEECRIFIEAYWNQSKRLFIETEFFVTKEQWDKDKKEVNYQHNNHTYINAQLKERIGKIQTYAFSLKSSGRHLTPELLDDFAKRKFENHKGISFSKFFEDQVKFRKFKTPATRSHHKKTFNKLQAFKKNIAFHELSVTLIEEFDAFMESQGLSINARGNHHKTLKANISLAATEGYIEHIKIPYATQLGGSAGKFSIAKEAGKIVFLDFEERERIEELSYPSNQTLERYRKIFLFMCYTGLRISDMENFKLSHLHYSSKGYEIDLHKMIKTRKPVFLQLYNLFEGKPEGILKDFLIESFGSDDYDKLREEHEDGIVFQYLTGQVINRELKTIAQDARIYKNVSNHVGRHTFGTQMAFLSNGNVNLVRDLMGHGKAETTMTYIRLADKMRGRLLQQVDWNSHREIAMEKPPVNGKNEIKKEPKPEPLKTKSDIQEPHIQLRQQIYQDVLPSIKLKTNGKALFAISEESIKRYTDLLPFSPEDFAKYQKNPIEIDGYIFEPQFMGNIIEVQDAINKHSWFKGACMKLRIMFTPITNGHQLTYI